MSEKRLHIETRNKQMLTELLATNSLLGGDHGENQVLEHILLGIRHIGFDRVRLYLLSDDKQLLLGKAQVGMKGNFVGVSWAVADDEYLQELIADPRPRVFEREPGKPTHPEDRLDKHGLNEWLCVPLVRNNAVIGLISADNKYSLRPIVEQKMGPLALFAAQASAAIENARLSAQKEEKLARLDEVSHATTEIFSNLGRMPLPEMLRLIVRRVAEILAAETSSILMVNQPGFLTLEASHGHREGNFAQGRQFAIRSGPRAGLIGHIAYEGRVFNAHGDQLTNHFAVRDANATHIPSGTCHSLLVIPFTQKGPENQVIGWLRVDNKQNREGVSDPLLRFTSEDEFVLQVFAEAIGAAIECARWLDELRREKEEKEIIIKSMPLATISIDKHGAVLTFNPQAEEIFGYSREEVVGGNVRKLYQNPREPRVIGDLLNQNNGQITDHKTEVRTRSGQIVPISLTARWLYEKGELVGSVGFFEDLRTQKRLELVLNASNVLAQAQNLTEGLQSLAEMMVSLFPDAFCRILLYDERDAALTVRASYPIAQTYKPSRNWESGLGSSVPVSEYPGLDRLLRKGAPEVVRHSNERQRPNLEKMRRHLGLDRPVRSMLLIPLFRGDKLVGLLDLGELHSEDQSQFTQDNIALVSVIAAQTTMLIEHRRLLEMAERRKLLLSELATVLERVRAEQGEKQLHLELARGFAQLTGCDAAGLLRHRPRLQQFEAQVALNMGGLARGQRIPMDEGMFSRATRTGAVEILHGDERIGSGDKALVGQNFKTVLTVPIKKSSGDVESILFAGDSRGTCHISTNDLEILERFATHASLALNTVRLIKSEHKRHDNLSLLDKINKFIQEANDKEKVLDAVLTAVTASYGLQFNRALVLLLDDARRQLMGAAGIGHLDEAEASTDWEEQKHYELSDFDRHLEVLKERGVTSTAVGGLARDLCFPLEEGGAGARLFAAILQDCEPRRVSPDQFDQLPAALFDKFNPITELVIAPLATKNRVIGMLIADNKFNRAPIKESDFTSLRSFADTAAIAIDNIRLLDSFSAFSGHLSSYQSPNELMEAIGKELCQVTGASLVGLTLIDERGHLTSPLTYPQDYFKVHPPMPRHNGYSIEVLSAAKFRTFPNIDNERQRLHPEFPPTTRAAACLPLCLPDKRIGVMWIHYEQPHNFIEFEMGLLQLFANHVANAYEAICRDERSETMRDAYESLALSNNAGELIKQIVNRVREFLRADCAVFWFYDNKGNEFLGDLSVAVGITENRWRRLQKLVPPKDSAAYRMLKQRYKLLTDLERPEQRQQLDGRANQFISEVGGRGMLGLPLNFGKESLGILYLIYRNPVNYGQEWLETASAFANYAALSLKNAKLLERVTRTNEAAKTVATVTKLGDIKKTLDEIVVEVKKATQCDAVVLFEHNQQSGEVVPHPLMPGVRYPERVLSPEESNDHWLVKRILDCGKATIVTDVPEHPEFRRTRFARDEESRSFLAMPLNAIDRKVGVLFVTYRRSHRFTTDEREIIELLADQTAVALSIALFIAERDRKQENMRLLLHEASKAITSSFGPDSEQVLDQLLEQGVRSLSQMKTSGRLMGMFELYDRETNAITVNNIYPPETRQLLLERVGDTWSLDKDKNTLRRIGVTGRSVIERRTLVVPDVTDDPDYICYIPTIKSVMCVPLFNKEGAPIGVINVESEHLDGFDKEDQEMLEQLAKLTVVVLENKDRYREHLKMQQAVEASNDLEFVSIAGATWWHAVRTHAQTIKETVQLLRDEINVDDRLNSVVDKLQRIEDVSNELLDKGKLTASLSDQQGVQRQALYPLIFERIRQLCERQNCPVEFHATPDSDQQATVKVNAHWVNRAIDILANNAFEAMPPEKIRELRLSITTRAGKVMVEIGDTGTGIPEEILAKLFKERIDKPHKGMGIGLMVARKIIKAYGGDLEVKTTGETGTTMYFWLPALDPLA